MRVWMLDPGAMTPYYDIALVKALLEVGIQVRLITSRYLYEPDVPFANEVADPFFFRAMERHGHLYSRLPWLRRAARLLIYPLDWLRLLREFAHDPPDLVHIQWTWLPVVDRFPISRIASRVPLILTVHDTEPRQASMTRLADMCPLYDLARFLIVHAEENRETLIRRARIDPGRIRTIPFGPPFATFESPSLEAARAELSLSRDSEVVLFFGTIKPNKGLIDLIEAMPDLVARRPKVHLLVIGRPEGSLDPYTKAVAKLGVSEHITFHAGFVASSRVPLYFAASDIVCLPYRQASQSAVLPTAYQFGCPVVVTRVGGLPESVEDGYNGLVVPPGSPEALAEALARLLADPDRLARFGQRSAELVHGALSWARAAALTTALYQETLANSTSGKSTGF